MLLEDGRETTIARMIAMGYNNKEIADHLFLAVVTVRKAIEVIRKKNFLRNRTQVAVAYAKTHKDI